MLSPSDTAQKLTEVARKKALLPLSSMVLLGFLAGAFIAFAAQGSTLVASDIPSFGMAKFVTGTVFTVGLMLVVLTGAELFTGNSLMTLGLFSGTITPGQLLRNWVVVYLANFLGSLTMAGLMSASGLWHLNGSKVGVAVVKIALGKVTMSFTEALVRGILCNWLVCLAVFLALSAQNVSGKMLGCFFPIMLFVASGFEHSIANMYYVPAGLLAMTDPDISLALGAIPVSAGGSQALTWGSFIANNLLPVTLGNIIGGVFFVALCFWLVYVRPISAQK